MKDGVFYPDFVRNNAVKHDETIGKNPEREM